MGHYWSEMSDDPPERHPTAIDTLQFYKVSNSGFWNVYYHRPCLQVFWIVRTGQLPDAIWNHAKNCKGST